MRVFSFIFIILAATYSWAGIPTDNNGVETTDLTMKCEGKSCKIETVIKTADPADPTDPIVAAATAVSADKALIKSTSATIVQLQGQLSAAQSQLTQEQTQLATDIITLNNAVNPQPGPVVGPPVGPVTPPATNVTYKVYTRAAGCVPCANMKPIYYKLTGVTYSDVSGDSSWQKDNVEAIPTIIAYKDGKEIGRIKGETDLETIQALSK